MGIFKASKEFGITVPDLEPVAEAVMQHFREQGYDVSGDRTLLQGWDISLHKGSAFKAVLGLQSALKIQIETAGTVTQVRVGIGIFGQQAIPTAISMLVFWPVLVTQIWGIVSQARLDQEAIDEVGRELERCAGTSSNYTTGGSHPLFCTACGGQLSAGMRFCPHCGFPQSGDLSPG
jgi:hypothetical protein